MNTENVVKTIEWSQSEALLKTLALQNLGRPQKGKQADFAAFIRSYPDTKLSKMAVFLEGIAKRHDVSDVTSLASISEDACLFSCGPASAVEIILRHLQTLNSGGKVDALWCFLDEDKRAVAHFINQNGWYAEAFFLCNEDFSVLHLLEDNGNMLFLPAVFSRDISEQTTLAEAAGSVILQTYLPRELYGLLANKSGKKKERQNNQQKQHDELISPQDKKFAGCDNGDLL